MTLGFDSVLVEVARSAIALLIAALAIYLSLRLLGKIAKFFVTVIILVVVAVVLYLIFSDHSILQTASDLLGKLA